MGTSLSLRLALDSGGAPSGPPAPSVTYLPTLTTSGASYSNVYSSERLISTYTGALLVGLNNTGGTLTDMGANPATGVAVSEITTLRGSGAAIFQNSRYDQAGANNLTSVTTPAFPTAGTRWYLEDSALIGGKVGSISYTYQNSPAEQATVSLNRDDFTVFMVIDPNNASELQNYFEFTNGATFMCGLYQTNTSVGTFDGPVFTHKTAPTKDDALGRFIPSVPQAIVISSTTTGVKIWMDGTTITLPKLPSGSITGLTVGASQLAGRSTYVKLAARMGAIGVINKGVNDTDALAIKTALESRFSITTNFNLVTALVSTSRGVGAGSFSYGYNRPWYERASINASYRPKFYNLSVSGQAMSTANTNKATREGVALPNNPSLPAILSGFDTINDLGGLGASTVPATIYTNALTPLNTFAHAMGAAVAAETTDPQSSGAGVFYVAAPGTIDGLRTTMNGLITGNGMGADGISDLAASGTMGVYPTSSDNTNLYYDKLHPTAGPAYTSNGGDPINAAISAAAINALISNAVGRVRLSLPATPILLPSNPQYTTEPGAAFSILPVTYGTATPITYALTGGTIGSSGLSVNASTGELSASSFGPVGVYGPYTITATDNNGKTSSVTTPVITCYQKPSVMFQGKGTAATSSVCTLTAGAAVGDMIVVSASVIGTTQAAAPIDNRSNTYTTRTSGANTVQTYQWTTTVTTALNVGDTVTVRLNAAIAPDVVIMCIPSGNSFTLGQSSATGTSDNPVITSASIASGQLAVGHVAFNGAGPNSVPTAPLGWTACGVSGSGAGAVFTFYRRVVVTGTQRLDAVGAASSAWVASMLNLASD